MFGIHDTKVWKKNQLTLLHKLTYRICGTFGGDFNLAVWRLSPNGQIKITTNLAASLDVYLTTGLIRQTKCQPNLCLLPNRQT